METATTTASIPDHDPVHANTAPHVNDCIERDMRYRIMDFASKSPAEISQRINELDQEWDMERYLECNASAFAFGGIAMSIFAGKKWLLVPVLVLPMLFYHAMHGWCPPVPLLRRLGIRTQREIDAEKYALRLLRGDFDQSDVPTQRAMRALEPELRAADK